MTKSLNAIAQKLMTPGQGILAADESEGTIGKRFSKINLPNTLEMRRDYREMLFGASEAMRLDSGSSTTLFVGGQVVNRRTERRVVSAIVFVPERR